MTLKKYGFMAEISSKFPENGGFFSLGSVRWSAGAKSKRRLVCLGEGEQGP